MSLSNTITLIPYLKRLLLICLTSLSCACTVQMAKETSRDETITIDQLISQFRQAEQQAPPEKDRRLLTVATKLAEREEYDWAYKAIQLIDSGLLNDSEYIDYSLVASRIFIQRQQLFKAQLLLTNPRLNQLWDKQTIDNQQILRSRRANLFSQLGNTEASINERIILSTILPPGQQEIENQEIIWRNLTSLSIEQLQLLATTTTTSVLQGWCQLATINKQYQDDLDTQNIAINEWVAANPNHPASYQLPKDLQLLQRLIDQRPKKIALLLPVQGKLAKAGRAIRDGFFAAYYHAINKGQDAPVVTVLDTSSEAIEVLYDQAVAEGVDVVIGPLSKEGVASLHSRPYLPVTTLALNYLDEPASTKEVSLSESPGNLAKDEPTPTTTPFDIINGKSAQLDSSAQLGFQSTLQSSSQSSQYSTQADTQANNLFQFGLSLDGEAVQVAERAWLEGHRMALVITPDANWSKRTARVFIQKWQALGGEVVNYSEFTDEDNYSTVVKSALTIDKSEQRASALKRLFGKSFEFEPRRRADIDMIFMIARTEQARQIKPALSFYYADNIPVYSTSQIFLSLQQDLNSNDLNGILFTTLPWAFDDNIPAKKAIQDNLTISDAYVRLYAMGADTFLLSSRLRQLQQITHTTLYGATGQLQLTENNRILRKQQWAEIYKGQARPLAAITTDDKKDKIKYTE